MQEHFGCAVGHSRLGQQRKCTLLHKFSSRESNHAGGNVDICDGCRGALPQGVAFKDGHARQAIHGGFGQGDALKGIVKYNIQV